MNRINRPTRIRIPLQHERDIEPVPIVSDALVSTVAVGEGRVLPLLILDTTSRPDIETMVLAHSDAPPGDVVSLWPYKRIWRGAPTVRLTLSITGPSDCAIFLDFDIERQGVLVDQILHAQGLYLQPGRPDDRLLTTLDKPGILVEVPFDSHFGKHWNPLFERAIFKRFRRDGLRRADARLAARDFIVHWRDLFHRRMPFGTHVNVSKTEEE